jgi:hypothetical protein
LIESLIKKNVRALDAAVRSKAHNLTRRPGVRRLFRQR